MLPRRAYPLNVWSLTFSSWDPDIGMMRRLGCNAHHGSSVPPAGSGALIREKSPLKCCFTFDPERLLLPDGDQQQSSRSSFQISLHWLPFGSQPCFYQSGVWVRAGVATLTIMLTLPFNTFNCVFHGYQWKPASPFSAKFNCKERIKFAVSFFKLLTRASLLGVLSAHASLCP